MIHLGVDHERFRPGGETREELLVYPARPWPHKNHARLFEAFAVLRERRTGLRSYSPATRATRRRAWGARPTSPRTSSRTVPALVGARVSEPVRGVRSAAARGDGLRLSRRSLERAVAARGVRRRCRLFDPRSVESMVAAVERVLDDPEPYRERGLRRAAEFSWERCAREHDAVYRELAR